jgi:hypothetical protein
VLIPWHQLLARTFTNVKDEYGPHSQSVAAAIVLVGQIKWVAHAGEPLAAEGIVVARSWDDAMSIFADTDYNVAGHLESACIRCDEAIESSPQQHAWWQAAREMASHHTILGGVPKSRPRDDRDKMFEYLYEFVSMLLVEIIADPADCTYFRDQLSWFHAGRFPCGWEGAWPVGKMRIY